MSKIGIVTVVTNEKHNLENFYNSLAEQTFKDFTLYFVDNNSVDGSAEFFRGLNQPELIDIKFIKLKENLGFSGGSNTGSEIAFKDGCNYLFIANNDLVLEKNCLFELYNLLEERKESACAAPLLLLHNQRKPDIIQEFGGKINYKTGQVTKYYENENIKDTKLPDIMETDFAGGGICFIKAEVFLKAGMFETSYFGYFDEIDLSYRLKVLNNYKIYVSSKAIAWHNHYSIKKNKKSYYFEYYLSERNKFLYFYKYKFYGSIIYMALIDLIKFPVRLIWFMRVCDFRLSLYYLKGMFDGLLQKKGRPHIER